MYIAHFAPDIICITEALPKNARYPVQNAEFQIEGYDMYTNIEGAHRGVIIYTAKYLKASVIDTQSIQCKESCWVEISLRNRDTLLVGCIYRSPNNSSFDNTNLLSALRSACEIHKYTHVMICGDFNCPHIDWEDGTTNAAETTIDHQLLECLRDCYLTQHVKEPTHRRSTQRPTTIDLVLTNEENMIEQLKVEPPLGKSHHSTLVYTLRTYAEIDNKIYTSIQYDKGNYAKFRDKMTAYDWENDLEPLSCEEAWMLFKDRFNKHSNECIPKKIYKGGKKNKPPWMNTDALNKIKQKSKAHRRYLKSLSNDDYTTYSRARNQARWECRKAKKQFERCISTEAKKNPKAFYKYVNSKTKTTTGVSNLKTETGMATTDQEKAEALNQFFTGVFTKETQPIPVFEQREIQHQLCIPIITSQDVLKKLTKMKPNKSPGPDGIHPRPIRELGDSIAKPIAHIINKTLAKGEIPSEWKEANVTPVFKKGKKSECGNYRPVSLTSVVCKLAESIIRDSILQHLKQNKLLVSCQHGFCQGRSCSTQLLYCLDIWTNLLDSGLDVDAIYLDFAKAFDSVPHERLLRKAKGYGIRDGLLEWIRSFLIGRRQKVTVKGASSEWSSVTSGVPQGSVLGPLLFVLFVNDMPDVVQSYIALFADDAKLFTAVTCPEDHQQLQDDLNKLHAWTTTWQLKFNATKCKVMHLGRRNPKSQYKIENTTLENTVEEKDLGVTIDPELKMDAHIERQVNKANSILGMIRRTFDHLDNTTFINLYKSMVRPHLEYCHAVTFPRFERQVKLLENVQRRATKLVPGLKDLSYTDRLKKLKLPTLTYRRHRGDIIEAYKYIHGHYQVESSPLVLDDRQIIIRGHEYRIKKARCNTSLRQHFFINRIVSVWNNLPRSVVSAPSINALKNRLDSHWEERKYMITFD